MTVAVLNPTYDNRIISSAATATGDSAGELAVGEHNSLAQVGRPLIKFDFSGIPANALVSSAVFELYAIEDNSSNTRIYRIYRLKRNWVPAEATWNIWSTGNNWSTAGADGADDRESADIGSYEMANNAAINAWYSWSLTPSKVQEWISGAFANYGLIIRAETENNDQFRFESLENAGGHDPKLTITYTVGLAGVKTVNGVAIASVKTVNGIAIASVKSIQGIT